MIDNTSATVQFRHQGQEFVMPVGEHAMYMQQLHFGDPDGASETFVQYAKPFVA